LTTIL
jgi:hypothetical protein